MHQIASFEIGLLNWLHGHLLPHSVPVLQFISDTTTLVSIGIAVTVLVLALVHKSKPLRTKFILLLAVLLLTALLTRALKTLIDRDRPFTTYPHIEKLSSGGDSSFPSGHTLEAFAMATAVSFLFRRKWILLPAYTWAFLVAYSRMALGVHYPSDVMAGLVIGSLTGWFVPWFSYARLKIRQAS